MGTVRARIALAGALLLAVAAWLWLLWHIIHWVL